jgi:SAM-dependent methyltransferase
MKKLSHPLTNSCSNKAADDTYAMKNIIYGRGYYHGDNSGYPEEGYRSAHPDWKAWLDLITHIQPPPGLLFDCGTAFGFLPDGAASRGYQALGCDISSYALQQEPSFRSFLLRGDSERLPVRSGSADVVCLFDVLEHLDNPVNALEEAVRILKPDGILAGATPDPLFFQLHEETHCFERCPSFWIHHLRRLGLKTIFRFSNIPENFQFMASFQDSGTAKKLDIFQHDYFSHDPDILKVSGSEARNLTCVLRQGWDTFRQDSRKIKGESASFYLLNDSEAPVECRLKATIPKTSSLPRIQLRLDSLVLDSYTPRPGETVSEIITAPFSLPAGGHHIHIDLLPPQDWALPIKTLTLETLRKISPELHTSSLPFDLYQRYRFAGDVIQTIQPASILDAGGNLGDANGHLAVSHEFFSSPDYSPSKIISSDLRHCDHPDHIPGNALSLPFPDKFFEMVVSLDVLEHIPGESRLHFLEELNRVSSNWILLAAPFASPEVKKAEKALVSELGLHFLDEHTELGLPQEDLITNFFKSEKGCHIQKFENGYLPRWFQMLPLTQMVFSIHNYSLFKAFNRHYNELYYKKDNISPGYRTFFLISREPVPEQKLSMLESLSGNTPARKELPGQEAEDFQAFPFFQDFLELMESRSGDISDLAFLLAEREKHIKILMGQVREYEKNPIIRIIKKLSRAIRSRD